MGDPRLFALGEDANDYYHVAVPLAFLRDDEGNRKLLVDGERRFPDRSRIQIMLALLEITEGRAEEAVARATRLSARAPQDEEVKFLRADLAFLTNASDLERVLEPLMEQSASNFGSLYESIRLRYAYVLGRRGDATRAAPLLAEAERIARGKMEQGDQSSALRIELAAASALRGDHAGALEWLSRAYDAGCRDYGVLELDPFFATLRGDPRYRELLERMRKDVAAQRARARERGLLDIDALLAPRK